MCDMDCFNCCKADCDNDEVTAAEIKEQDQHDRDVINERKYGKTRKIWLYEKSLRGRERKRRYLKSAKGKVAVKKYLQSEKGKETARRYAQSEKGKATQKRYLQSDKGRAAVRRKNQKQIANGKNAEYCRTYYYRQKEKKLMELMRG